MLDFVKAHLGLISTGLALAAEFILRKWPGATPLFQTLNNVLDQLPGFKNKT